MVDELDILDIVPEPTFLLLRRLVWPMLTETREEDYEAELKLALNTPELKLLLYTNSGKAAEEFARALAPVIAKKIEEGKLTSNDFNYSRRLED